MHGFDVEMVEFLVVVLGSDGHVLEEAFEGDFLKQIWIGGQVRSFFSAMYLIYSPRKAR